MHDIIHSQRRFSACLLLSAAAGSLAFSGAANALRWESGDAEVSLETNLSFGASVRVEERDPSLIGHRGALGAGASPVVDEEKRGTAFSVNGDDGNLNYDKGDVIAAAFRARSDLSLSWRNYYAFVRGIGLYDPVNDRDCLYVNGCDNPAGSPIGNSHLRRSDDVRGEVGKNFEILDAFIGADFSLGQRTLSLKLGQQVLNWGESTLIPGGINFNAFDLPKLRVPGAELREAFIPAAMAWGLLDLTDNVSAEAFYQVKWERTEPDPVGTYFATSDLGGIGASIAMLGFGAAPENAPGATVNRRADRTPEDDGQYGVTLRYFAEWLYDTEFAAYAAQYHSRLPLLSGFATVTANDTGAYFREYPEDIRLYGISFNTTIASAAVSGEVVYRQDNPLQVDDVELLFAALGFDNQIGNFVGGGNYIQGFRRFDTMQAQATIIKTFGQDNPFGGDDFLLLLEVGVNHVLGMPDESELRLEGPGTYAKGGNDPTGLSPIQQVDGYATASSWGYRLVTRISYLNAFGSVNVFPRLVFFHDANGVTPGPGGAFVEGRKSLGLGVNFEYRNRYTFDMAYNAFFGGGEFNLIRDRDFASVSVGVSF